MLQNLFTFLVLFLGMLYFFQNRLIYFPIRYQKNAVAAFHRPLIELYYKLDGRDQIAFYAPPLQNADALPPHIWILFYGNAGPVLRYDDWLRNSDSSPDGFLLVDYPGFGFNQGSPSPDAAARSAEIALTLLAQKFSITPLVLQQRMGALGTSLGSAAALQFVVDHLAVRSLVMIAPFTRLKNMARLRFGPLYLLAHNAYDNEANLNLLAARSPRPYVAIVHGSEDDVVPVTMGRKLADEHQGWIKYQEVPGAHHSDILDLSGPQTVAAMKEADALNDQNLAP